MQVFYTPPTWSVVHIPHATLPSQAVKNRHSHGTRCCLRTVEERLIVGELRCWLALELAQGAARSSAVQVQTQRINCASKLTLSVSGALYLRA